MARSRRADELPIVLTDDMPPEELRFVELANAWWAECATMSSPTRQRAHWAVQSMLAEGPAMVGPLVKHIETEPRTWCYVLAQITGANPTVGAKTGAKGLQTWRDWYAAGGWPRRG